MLTLPVGIPSARKRAITGCCAVAVGQDLRGMSARPTAIMTDPTRVTTRSDFGVFPPARKAELLVHLGKTESGPGKLDTPYKGAHPILAANWGRSSGEPQ
jgi:hypothetical protein